MALAAEAVALLENEPPSPALVSAYGQLANAQAIAGAYAEAIAAADRARALSELLDLPEPARALGYRGFSRVYLGDADGLAEMERAFALLEPAAGQDTGSLQNNMALARYPLEGPARAIVDFEQAIAFCEQRGLAEAGAALEANCPGLLVELGSTEQALERAGRLAAAAEASGTTHLLIELRSVELAARLARGEREDADLAAVWLIDAARHSAAADMIVLALAPAAITLTDQGPALLAELEQSPGARETTYYARQLAGMSRTALAARDAALAKRLAAGLESRYPLDEHALCATSAQLAEHAEDHVDAAALYAESADRWHGFEKRSGARLRAPWSGALPARAQPAGSRAAAPRSACPVCGDGLPAGARGDGDAVGAARGRARLVGALRPQRFPSPARRCPTGRRR